jgi:hypothetical protein
MTNHPTPQSPEERELQEVFDETAELPSEAQLERMIARAEQIPGGQRNRRRSAWLIPLAAAAAVALAIGGSAWWAQDRENGAPVASTATSVPTATPTAVASVDPKQDSSATDDTYDDIPVLPADPLAVLDGDFDNGGGWMGELDLLHGPAGDGDDGFWEEMELLMEEGG